MRSKKFKFAVILSIILCISLILQSTCVYAENELNDNELYSLSAVVIDGDSGRILYEKNGYEVRAMASTTKIMTLIIALEYGNMEDLVSVSSYAAKMPDVQLGIIEGEQYVLEDLLYSLILESHNDVAVAIAEHVGGSVEDFADMMNSKAKEIGLSSTYFITPNGLDASDEKGVHSTNAVELALIMRYCVSASPMKDEFLKICQTRSHSFCDYEGQRSFTVNNKNRLLDMMEGVMAGKTGFTADAGYCYTAALKSGDRTFIIALLGCGWPGNKNYKWMDSKKLFQHCINNYDYDIVVDANNFTREIGVINGIEGEYVDTYIKDSIEFLVCPEDVVDVEYKLPEILEAPVDEGTPIGEIDIIINGVKLKSLWVYPCNKINDKDYKYFLNEVFSSFLF